MRLLTLKTILIATDLDEASVLAVEAARMLATAAGGTLHVVYATRGDGSNPDVRRWLADRARIDLDEPFIHRLPTQSSDTTVSLAEHLGADVIVLGPGSAASSRVTGAVAVASNGATPCLIVRAMTLPLERVLVAVDLSETSRGALVVALSWACALRLRSRVRGSVEISLLHVAAAGASEDDVARMGDALELQAARLRDDAPSSASIVVRCEVATDDAVAETILDLALARRADLVVLGTHGQGLDGTGRLGSVASVVAAAVALPTLLVPPGIWLELGRVVPRRRARAISRVRVHLPRVR